jgi:hypothetical protein
MDRELNRPCSDREGMTPLPAGSLNLWPFYTKTGLPGSEMGKENLGSKGKSVPGTARMQKRGPPENFRVILEGGYSWIRLIGELGFA